MLSFIRANSGVPIRIRYTYDIIRIIMYYTWNNGHCVLALNILYDTRMLV